jgi:carbonic anhydrase
VLRNAGARVTPDVLRSLAAAVSLLGVERVAVVHHTDCAMTRVTDEDIVEAIGRRGGRASMVEFDVITDEKADLRGDVDRIRESPMLSGVPVAGFRYDVHTGELRREV